MVGGVAAGLAGQFDVPCAVGEFVEDTVSARSGT
ncbi:hypothetical protein QF035_000333 [Streptomyces umbrinus]|uniref:Uncharacterized protein n=1 Tax=Streptomyces umbrinus TaxID=67370 RepID=A0ABU0SJ90_9ACTN|nr:hypothetical protein [Streptomyces umbrinus]